MSAPTSAATLDAPQAQRRKLAGQQLALEFDDSWHERVIDEFRAWARQRLAMGLRLATIEEFRASAQCQPRSHKAWGALPRLLVRAGLIGAHTHADGSPVYVRAASVKTHAHPVRQWVLTANA